MFLKNLDDNYFVELQGDWFTLIDRRKNARVGSDATMAGIVKQWKLRMIKIHCPFWSFDVHRGTSWGWEYLSINPQGAPSVPYLGEFVFLEKPPQAVFDAAEKLRKAMEATEKARIDLNCELHAEGWCSPCEAIQKVRVLLTCSNDNHETMVERSTPPRAKDRPRHGAVGV